MTVKVRRVEKASVKSLLQQKFCGKSTRGSARQLLPCALESDRIEYRDTQFDSASEGLLTRLLPS